jgi:hypothetical protein
MDTVIPVDADWNEDFQEWLEPFLAVFKRSEQRCWAPLYLQGLLGPGGARVSSQWLNACAPGRRSNSTTSCRPRPGPPPLWNSAA